MWSTRFAAAALTITGLGFIAACSPSEEGSASIVSEARANPATSKDYGWRATPDFPAVEKDLREYH